MLYGKTGGKNGMTGGKREAKIFCLPSLYLERTGGKNDESDDLGGGRRIQKKTHILCKGRRVKRGVKGPADAYTTTAQVTITNANFLHVPTHPQIIAFIVFASRERLFTRGGMTGGKKSFASRLPPVRAFCLPFLPPS